MARLVVIAGPDACLGFNSAGVETREVDGAEPGEVLSEVFSDEKYGIVIVDDGLLGRAPANLMARVEKRGYPIVVPVTIPDRWEEEPEGESPVVRLIRRAIGYQIKIRK